MPNRKKGGQWLVACKTARVFLFLFNFCFTSWKLRGGFSSRARIFQTKAGSRWRQSLKQKTTRPSEHQCLEDESSPLFFLSFSYFFFVVVGHFHTQKNATLCLEPSRNGDRFGFFLHEMDIYEIHWHLNILIMVWNRSTWCLKNLLVLKKWNIYLSTYLSKSDSPFASEKKNLDFPCCFDTSWFFWGVKKVTLKVTIGAMKMWMNMMTLPETNSKFAPENGGLEDDYWD